MKDVTPHPRREFYVNGKLEFSLFYDPNEETNPKKVMKEFIGSKDWKSFIEYIEEKPVSWKCNKTLTRFKILTEKQRPTKGKKK